LQASGKANESLDNRAGWDWLLAWGAYSLLALVMSLPVILDLGQNLGAKGDNLLNAWILWRINENLITRPWELFTGNIFHPYEMVMSYSETMLAGALSVLPAHILGANPVTQYNLLKLIAFSLNGLGMYLLARLVTGSRMAGFIGGLIFAFALPRYNLNLQMHCSHFLPFVFWALLRHVKAPSAPKGWAVAAFTLLTMLSNAHYALFVVYALGFWMLFELVWSRGRNWLHIIKHLIIPGLVMGAVAVGLFWPYLGKPPRLLMEVLNYSNTWLDLVRPHHASWFYSALIKMPGANQWFFGLVPWLLGLLSIGVLFLGRAGGRTRHLIPALVMGALAAWASVGPEGWLYGLIWEYLPGFKGIRGVNRIAILSLAAISLLAAHGASVLLKRNNKGAWLICGLICALFLIEAVSIPDFKNHLKLPDTTGQRFAWLAERPKVKNILYLPMHYEEVDITYASRMHGKQMVNGYSGYFPPLYNWFKKHQGLFPHPSYVKALQAFEVDHVVLELGLFNENREAIERSPDLQLVANQAGLALIKVRPQQIELDRKAVMQGRVDLLWDFNQLDLNHYALSLHAQPKQPGPLVKAVVEVHNQSPHSLPDGVLQFWARVEAQGGWREALVRMPGLKPDQKKKLTVGAVLPWSQEQTVTFKAALRVENKLQGPEISAQTRLSPSRSVKVLRVQANPEAHHQHKIIDGDITTRWTSNQTWKPGEYVQLEIEPVALKGIYLLNHENSMGDHPKGLEIYTSMDGKKWSLFKRLESLTAQDLTGQAAVWLDLKGVNTKYIRLVPTHHRPHHWWSLHEAVLIVN
jgi:hypothetical protein